MFRTGRVTTSHPTPIPVSLHTLLPSSPTFSPLVPLGPVDDPSAGGQGHSDRPSDQPSATVRRGMDQRGPRLDGRGIDTLDIVVSRTRLLLHTLSPHPTPTSGTKRCPQTVLFPPLPLTLGPFRLSRVILIFQRRSGCRGWWVADGTPVFRYSPGVSTRLGPGVVSPHPSVTSDPPPPWFDPTDGTKGRGSQGKGRTDLGSVGERRSTCGSDPSPLTSERTRSPLRLFPSPTDVSVRQWRRTDRRPPFWVRSALAATAGAIVHHCHGGPGPRCECSDLLQGPESAVSCAYKGRHP